MAVNKKKTGKAPAKTSPARKKPKRPVKAGNPQKQPKKSRPKPQKPPKPPKKWDTDIRIMSALRFVLVLGVVGLVAIGIWNIAKGDQSPQLRAEIRSVSQVAQTGIVIHTEAEAFAQDFIKTYLTYKSREVDDYRKRLEQYCMPKLAGDITENLLLRETAEAVYVQAFNISEYGPGQYDISVMAEVAYTKQPEPTRDIVTGTLVAAPAVTEKKVLYFIVPLYSDGYGGYVVEDIPRVAAPPKAISYNYQDYTGTYADEADKAAAQQMLNDFFRTLYSDPQNKIDYYLAENADKSKFKELLLNGSMDFVRIESLLLYKTAVADEFMGLVSIKISDTNGTEIRQRFNILLQKRDKFYAKDINLRTYNLKIQ